MKTSCSDAAGINKIDHRNTKNFIIISIAFNLEKTPLLRIDFQHLKSKTFTKKPTFIMLFLDFISVIKSYVKFVYYNIYYF